MFSSGAESDAQFPRQLICQRPTREHLRTKRTRCPQRAAYRSWMQARSAKIDSFSGLTSGVGLLLSCNSSSVTARLPRRCRLSPVHLQTSSAIRRPKLASSLRRLAASYSFYFLPFPSSPRSSSPFFFFFRGARNLERYGSDEIVNSGAGQLLPLVLTSQCGRGGCPTLARPFDRTLHYGRRE